MGRIRKLRALFVLAVLGFAGWTYLHERADVRPMPSEMRFESLEPPDLPPVVASAGALTLRGRLLTLAGAPLAQASVVLRTADQPFWASTDAQGRFQLDELPAGTFQLCALAFEYSPQIFAVELPAAEELTFTMSAPRPPLPALAELVRADLLGRVSASDRASLAGCELWLEPAPGSDPLGGTLPRRETLAADGSFRFTGLAAGDYLARVLPPWAGGGTWPVLSEAALHHTRESALFELELHSGEIAGRALDIQGQPIDGALVLLRDAVDEKQLWEPRATDAEGRFRIGDVPAGTYELEIHAGSAQHSLKLVLASGEHQEVALPAMDPRGG